MSGSAAFNMHTHVEQEGASANKAHEGVRASVQSECSLAGIDQNTLFWKSSRPQKSGKHQVSGYTRRRRNLAMQRKLQACAAAEDAAHLRHCDDIPNWVDSATRDDVSQHSGQEAHVSDWESTRVGSTMSDLDASVGGTLSDESNSSRGRSETCDSARSRSHTWDSFEDGEYSSLSRDDPVPKIQSNPAVCVWFPAPLPVLYVTPQCSNSNAVHHGSPDTALPTLLTTMHLTGGHPCNASFGMPGSCASFPCDLSASTHMLQLTSSAYAMSPDAPHL
jgi:hypothetical protein